jgi:hypothetical protein
MPFWGSRSLSSQEQLVLGVTTSGPGAAVLGQQSIGATSGVLQQQQPLLQQEFVPMVPYGLPQPGSQASSQPGDVQPLLLLQPRYVALAEAPTDDTKQRQQQRDTSGTSTPSSPSAPQLSGQLRQQQLQRTARFDPTSGGSSSYIGGAGRARSGEAQTWLILEYCDGGTLLDLMQEGLLFRVDTGQVNMVSDWCIRMGWVTEVY